MTISSIESSDNSRYARAIMASKRARWCWPTTTMCSATAAFGAAVSVGSYRHLR
jgi:hypothetical protein